MRPKRLMNCFIRFIYGVPICFHISPWYSKQDWLFPKIILPWCFIIPILVNKKAILHYWLHQANFFANDTSDLYIPSLSHRTAYQKKSQVILAISFGNFQLNSIHKATNPLTSFKHHYFSITLTIYLPHMCK